MADACNDVLSLQPRNKRRKLSVSAAVREVVANATVTMPTGHGLATVSF